MLFVQRYPSVCRAAVKRSLKKIAGFGAGYRRITLLVNLLQVVKRTNTPLITLTNGVVGRTMGFGVVGSIPTIHNNKLFRFSPCRT